MDHVINITKAISDKTRVRALFALFSGELCVCQITELLELAPSTVSKHMSILKQAKLVENKKQGRWIHYQLPENASRHTEEILKWLFENLSADEQIINDGKRLKNILKIDKEALCTAQKKN